MHDLASTHKSLVEALARLEEAGAFAAAAHVAAALDVLEPEVGRVPHADTANSPVVSFATQMRRVFGERAESVARRQLSESCGVALMGWALIVDQFCV